MGQNPASSSEVEGEGGVYTSAVRGGASANTVVENAIYYFKRQELTSPQRSRAGSRSRLPPSDIEPTMPIPRSLLDNLRKIIPPLDGSLHKGQSGRVGVIGGAQEYVPTHFLISRIRSMQCVVTRVHRSSPP